MTTRRTASDNVEETYEKSRKRNTVSKTMFEYMRVLRQNKNAEDFILL